MFGYLDRQCVHCCYYRNMKIKFGIVGCGYIAQRHAEHIMKHPDGQLVSGFDLKSEKCSAFAGKFGTAITHSAAQVYSNSEIDIISICTPNGIHHSVAIEALKAGKHVLIEKPMSISTAHCKEIILASEQYNREIFIVKQNRYNPPVQAVKKLIDLGKLGEIYYITTNCFWNRGEDYYKQSDWKGSRALDGGTLFTQFSHFIDIFYYLFGDITNIHGRIKNSNHQGLIDFEDTGSFIFDFLCGAQGSLNYTTCTYNTNMEGSITIFAENATIKMGGKYLNTIDFQSTKGFDITNLETSEKANNYGFYEGSMSNHDKVIDNVISTLQGKSVKMTSALEGMQVVNIIERMYAHVANKE